MIWRVLSENTVFSKRWLKVPQCADLVSSVEYPFKVLFLLDLL